MRFLMIYPNQWAIGNKPIGIATLAAVLKRNGHDFKLFDFTSFVLGDGSGYERVGEMSMEFRPIKNRQRLPQRKRLSRHEVFQRLLQEIKLFKPDMIGLSALSDDYPLGLQVLRYVRKHVQVPTIVGGLHPTVDPAGVLSESCVDMICIGEGEGAIADIGERFDRGQVLSTIPNLWVKTDGGTVRNGVRPLIQDLDSLPFPDWTIYPDVSFYKAFDGCVYKYGDFEISRGCPYKCSYCINVELQNVYAGKGEYHREKSVKRVIEEVLWFKQEYGIEFFKFWDETFLNMSRERLETLTSAFSERVRLPFSIETTAQSVTPITASLLKKFGCASASLGLETGNVDLRKGVLDKNTDDTYYERAYALLRENAIRGVSFNMIGLPFERREDIFQSIRLNKRLGTDAQAVGIFYPYKGTPIRRFCEERGFINEDFEKELFAKTGAEFGSFTKDAGSVLKLCALENKQLVRLRTYFSWYVFSPEWMWGLVDECGFDTEFSRKLEAALFRTLQMKKYGELPAMEPEAGNGETSATPSMSCKVVPGLESLRAELPTWLEPMLSACEQEPVLAQALPFRLRLLYASRRTDGGSSKVEEGQGRGPEVDEQFNQGGKLQAVRLIEIRHQMRKLAKEDVEKRLDQTAGVD